MCKFIGVEILAANVLINLIESGKRRSVSLEELNKCGIEVVNILEKKFNEKAVVLYDKTRIGSFVVDYSDFFKFEDDTLYVKDNVEDTEQLRDWFRGTLSYEILSAIITSVKSLLKN